MKVVDWSEVKPTRLWPHEAHDFTPWLSERLHYLEEAVGLDLELEGIEMSVGPFSADLVARTVDGRRMVVENQLHTSDHSHLGQLITYAASLDAEIVVWIASRFRPEYLTALQWANENTREDLGFFALRIEVVRAGDDEAAFRLMPVVEPDWQAKAAKTTASGLTPKQQLYQQFWTEVLGSIHETYPTWTSSRTPAKDSWMVLPAGRSDFWYSINFTATRQLRVELYHHPKAGTSSEELFELLEDNKPEIESAFGDELSWEPLENRVAARVAYYRDGVVDDENAWPELRAWAVTKIGQLKDAIQPFVDSLPAAGQGSDG